MRKTKNFNLNNLKELKQAEQMQERLYNKYDYVKFVYIGNNIGYIEYK